MTFQWTAVALLLYGEIVVCLILLLPWIRPSLWRRVLHSPLVGWLATNSAVFFYTGAVVLLLLFTDAVRETLKYQGQDERLSQNDRATADRDTIIHMRLFRAQRNLYISGFALLLFLVIRRVISLILHCAQLSAASEAALRQAEGASKTAQTLMNAANTEGGNKEADKKIKELGEELKRTQVDRDTLKKQALQLQKEYDNLADKLNKLEADGANKKDD